MLRLYLNRAIEVFNIQRTYYLMNNILIKYILHHIITYKLHTIIHINYINGKY